MQYFRTSAGCGVWVLFFLLSGCNQQDTGVTEKSSPLRVRTEQIHAGEFRPSARVTGSVRAKTQTELAFRAGGKVTARYVNTGDKVHPGDVLARLDDTEQKADVAIAEANLNAALATLRQKELTYKRYKALVASQVIARATYDDSRTEYVNAQGNVTSARADLAAAQENLSYTVMKATAKGVVTATSIEAGEVVSATETAFTLAQDGARDAVFYVYESFFLQGKPDKNVCIKYPDESTCEITGQIREISPVVDESTGTIRVKVALPPSRPFPLGTAVEGKFIQSTRNRVSVAWSAIDSWYGKPIVWVVDPKNHVVLRREVDIGQYEPGRVVIRAGLRSGERVVVDGIKFMREGKRITWQDAS